MGTRKVGKEFVKLITEIITNSTGFEKTLERVKITDGGNGRCTAELTVGREHLNRSGSLHGGYTATLIDMVTTYALMSQPCHPGVTIDLRVSYMKGAREGDEILIEANTVRVGKKLAFVDCVLRHKKDKSVIAQGGQTKYVDFENR